MLYYVYSDVYIKGCIDMKTLIALATTCMLSVTANAYFPDPPSGSDLDCVAERGLSCIKSNIQGQKLTLAQKKDIVVGLHKVFDGNEKAYGKMKVAGMVYFGSDVIYDSEEYPSHLYLVKLYFGYDGYRQKAYKVCEITIDYNKNEKIDRHVGDKDLFRCDDI